MKYSIYAFSVHSDWWKWRDCEVCACAGAHSDACLHPSANASIHPVHTLSTGATSTGMSSLFSHHLFCAIVQRSFIIMLLLSRCLFLCSSPDITTLLKRKTLNVACLPRAQWKTMRWRKEKTSLRYLVHKRFVTIGPVRLSKPKYFSIWLYWDSCLAQTRAALTVAIWSQRPDQHPSAGQMLRILEPTWSHRWHRRNERSR